VTAIHWVIGIWAVSAVTLIAFEVGFLPGARIWDLDEPWKSSLICGVLVLLSPFVVVLAISVGVIEYFRICWGRLIGKIVRIDVATADAVQAAINAGDVLARDIRIDLEEAAVSAKMDITPALDTALNAIDGGSGKTEPGSLLKAVCIGTVAAVGIRELYMSQSECPQRVALHAMLAQALAAWEVGQENIGCAPNPWQGRAHFSWPPGTFIGGKKSVANKLMISFIATGETPREENATYFVKTIIASLGLTFDPCIYPLECSELHKLGLKRGLPILPQSAIKSVAKRILDVDLFWPSYLDGKEVI
jgi:hypothetical protein